LCDCEWQREESKRRVADSEYGLILFATEQHGKGVGQRNHFRIYSEGQRRGLELVVDAYRMLGFNEDYREYGGAAAILEARGIKSLKLLTNSPS
jgi:GTP cyclohydrolase II